MRSTGRSEIKGLDGFHRKWELLCHIPIFFLPPRKHFGAMVTITRLWTNTARSGCFPSCVRSNSSGNRHISQVASTEIWLKSEFAFYWGWEVTRVAYLPRKRSRTYSHSIHIWMAWRRMRIHALVPSSRGISLVEQFSGITNVGLSTGNATQDDVGLDPMEPPHEG